MVHDPAAVIAAGEPLETSRAVVVMVHGRGAGPRNILELAPLLARPGVAYLAPAATNNTWYPLSFLSEIARNEPSLSSALDMLDAIVAGLLARGVPRNRIVLLGFSQGACLSGEFAVRHAGRYGGVVMLSGGLIGPPGATWHHPGSFDGTPVFLGCSDTDAHVPKERVSESADVFTRMGADVTLRIYPGMGHLVNDDEVMAAREVLDRALAGAGPLHR